MPVINFTAISKQSWVGRALRASLSIVPDNAVVPILQGPLRGKKWIVGSCIHSCWLGNYETAVARAFEASVRPESIFFDIGAQAGYHTLLASKLVGPRGRVLAFEPAPQNAVNLRRHLAMNRTVNVEVIEAAVSDVDGTLQFDRGSNPVSGRISPNGNLTVRSLSIDHEIDRGVLPEPDYIKIDVEGQEAKVLDGARKLLLRRHPTLFIETHQWLRQFTSSYDDCKRILQEVGYEVEQNVHGLNSNYHLLARGVLSPRPETV